MKVLVTGANGLLGQKLSLLLDQDPDVQLIATARGSLAQDLPHSTYAPLDITDNAATDTLLQKWNPDVVVNAAALTMVDYCEEHREECWRANVKAVDNLVKACQNLSAHLLHVSTDFIFDGKSGPLGEEAVPSPVNFYGESKLAGEKLVMQSSLSWAIVRTVLVYGITKDLSRSNIVLWVKESLEKKKPIKVVNDQWRTPTLAEDLALGCYLVVKKKATGVFHISGKDYLTPYDIAIRTAQFYELDERLITPVPTAEFKQPAQRPLRTGFIIEKARRILGYEPKTFDEGLHILDRQLSAKRS